MEAGNVTTAVQLMTILHLIPTRGTARHVNMICVRCVPDTVMSQLIKQAPQSVTFAKPEVLTPRQCGGLASVVSQKKTHGKSEAVCHLPESTMSFQHLQLKKAIFLLFLRTQTIINASSAWKNQRMLLLFMVKQGIAAVAGPVRKS